MRKGTFSRDELLSFHVLFLGSLSQLLCALTWRDVFGGRADRLVLKEQLISFRSNLPQRSEDVRVPLLATAIIDRNADPVRLPHPPDQVFCP